MASSRDDKPKGWRDLPTLRLERGPVPSPPPKEASASPVAYNVRSIDTLVSELLNRSAQLFKGG
jgi:hypothetical protein